jgi:hypothetical protein
VTAARRRLHRVADPVGLRAAPCGAASVIPDPRGEIRPSQVIDETKKLLEIRSNFWKKLPALSLGVQHRSSRKTRMRASPRT